MIPADYGAIRQDMACIGEAAGVRFRPSNMRHALCINQAVDDNFDGRPTDYDQMGAQGSWGNDDTQRIDYKCPQNFNVYIAHLVRF